MALTPLPVKNDPTFHAPPHPRELCSHDWRFTREGIVGHECVWCGKRRLTYGDG